MSITTKVVLRTYEVLANGEYALMLRIIEDRKISYVTLRKSSKIEDWDKHHQQVSKRNPDHISINSLIKRIQVKIDWYFSSLAETNENHNVEKIKEIAQRIIGTIKNIEKKRFYAFFEEEINRLKNANRLGYAETYQSTLNSIKKYKGVHDIEFSEIGLEFLTGYKDYLLLRNCAITTQSVYFRTFRTVWRSATKVNIVNEDHYPFKDFEFSKFNNPRTKKRAISKDQITSLINLEIESTEDKLINSRNYFLFSFYCRGLNFTDLASLKWNNIKDEELHYIRAKTKEEFSFKLHPDAKKIIEYYKILEGNSDAGYMFPILYKRHDSPQSIRDRKKKVLKRVNKDLKEMASKVGIEKRLTTYVARHSYATTLLIHGMTKEEIGRTLGHDDLKTTEIYLEEIGNPLIDDQVNSIL